MTAKNIIILIVFLGIIGVSLFVLFQPKKPSSEELIQAEQAVYAALLSEQKSAYNTDTSKLQIVEFTNSGERQGNIPSDSAGIHTTLEKKDFPDLQNRTFQDFQEKNKVSSSIKNYLPSSADVVFVNPANGEQLYWWVSFSRVGFNPSLDQALVLVGDCRGESCYDSSSNSMYSQGSYVMLEKQNGQWKIQQQRDAWLIEAPSP